MPEKMLKEISPRWLWYPSSLIRTTSGIMWRFRLNRGADPDAMNKNLRVNIVRVIFENISDMCVGALRVSDYQR